MEYASKLREGHLYVKIVPHAPAKRVPIFGRNGIERGVVASSWNGKAQAMVEFKRESL